MQKQLLCLLAASGLSMIAASAGAAMQIQASTHLAPTESQTQAGPSQIDYDGFVELTGKLVSYRQTRLLAKEDFFRRTAQADALLLDTRSAAAFAAGHIEGAVNLPFSDFTDEKLRQVIGPDRDRPIFIYCNNNFSDDATPVVAKKAPLALNIPTFINLYGYGYENIWELEGIMATAEVAWVGDLPRPLAD